MFLGEISFLLALTDSLNLSRNSKYDYTVASDEERL